MGSSASTRLEQFRAFSKIAAHIPSSQVAPPPWTTREATPARLPACFVVGMQHDAESPRRGLVGQSLKLLSASERGLLITECARITDCRRTRRSNGSADYRLSS
eukprot:15459117-Alexandrium_andersonii.AAC.1